MCVLRTSIYEFESICSLFSVTMLPIAASAAEGGRAEEAGGDAPERRDTRLARRRRPGGEGQPVRPQLDARARPEDVGAAVHRQLRRHDLDNPHRLRRSLLGGEHWMMACHEHRISLEQY